MALGAKETPFLPQDFQRMVETIFSRAHKIKRENIPLPLITSKVLYLDGTAQALSLKAHTPQFC